jgi:hypothetical protein
MLAPHVPAALQTLGEKAAAGDANAAKAVLDFVTMLAREQGGAQGSSVLAEIAKIRSASGVG